MSKCESASRLSFDQPNPTVASTANVAQTAVHINARRSRLLFFLFLLVILAGVPLVAGSCSIGSAATCAQPAAGLMAGIRLCGGLGLLGVPEWCFGPLCLPPVAALFGDLPELILTIYL